MNKILLQFKGNWFLGEHFEDNERYTSLSPLDNPISVDELQKLSENSGILEIFPVKYKTYFLQSSCEVLIDLDDNPKEVIINERDGDKDSTEEHKQEQDTVDS